MTVEGRIRPGQRISRGSRIPPSYKCPLPARNGALLVIRTVDLPSKFNPPLSEKNITTVRSATPAFSIAPSTLPTDASSVSTIAAYVGS